MSNSVWEIKDELERLDKYGRPIVMIGKENAGATTAARSVAHPDCINTLARIPLPRGPITYIYTNDEKLDTKDIYIVGEVIRCDEKNTDISLSILAKMCYDAVRSIRRDKGEGALKNALKKSLKSQIANAAPGSPAYSLKDGRIGELLNKAAELNPDELEFIYSEAHSGEKHDSEAVEEKFKEKFRKRFAELTPDELEFVYSEVHSGEKHDSEAVEEKFREKFRERFSERVAFRSVIKEFHELVCGIINSRSNRLEGYLEEYGVVEKHKFTVKVPQDTTDQSWLFDDMKPHRNRLSDIKLICRCNDELVKNYETSSTIPPLKNFALSFVNDREQEVMVWRIVDAGGMYRGSDTEQVKERIESILSREQTDLLIYVQNMNNLDELLDSEEPLYQFCLTSKKNTKMWILGTHLDEYVMKKESKFSAQINGGDVPSKEDLKKYAEDALEELKEKRGDLNARIVNYNSAKNKPSVFTRYQFGAGLMLFPDIREALDGHSYPHVMRSTLYNIAYAVTSLKARFRVSQDFTEKIQLDLSKCGGSYNIKSAYDNLIAFIGTAMHEFTREACYRKWIEYGESHESRDKRINTFFIDDLRHFFDGFRDKFNITELLSLISTDNADDVKTAENAINDCLWYLGKCAVRLLGKEARNDIGYSYAPIRMAKYIHKKYFHSNTIEMTDGLADIIKKAAEEAMSRFVRDYCIIV